MTQFKVGYIDEDEGQKNTFYQLFKSEFDVILLPVEDGCTADTLATDAFKLNLDLLVLDFRLDENGIVAFNADSIVDSIRQRNSHFPLIVLTSHEIDALDHLSDATLVNGKEEVFDKKSAIFSTKMFKIADSYIQECTAASETLLRLKTKLESEGLDPHEEDLYVRMNTFIEEISSPSNQVSSSFFSIETNKRLDTLIAKADQMLKKLS